MPAIKVRAIKENDLETVYGALWSREIERVLQFGNWLPYTMSLGLHLATVLAEVKHGVALMRTTRH